MKYELYIIGFLILIGFVSCEKKNGERDFCLKNISSSPNTSTLSIVETYKVRSIFDANKIDYSNLQFFKLQILDTDYLVVRCHQFVNNLMVFTDDLIFNFKHIDNFYYLHGELISKIDLDTKQSMNQNDLINLYIYELKKDSCYLGNIQKIINGCFEIEFGYFDLNAGSGNTEHNFTKAWKVKPEEAEYPFIFINDISSEIIYYDNGIRY